MINTAVESSPDVVSRNAGVEVSVVMPCLNEAETLAGCVTQAQNAMREAGIRGEVIVADNGSRDGSQEVAESLRARVVPVEAKGYGNALMGGIAAARGKFVIMGDSDGSYDFGFIPEFIRELRAGADVVLGNRFKGGIEEGAMPPLHKLLGNPALTWIARVFFRIRIGDIYCGLRGFRKDVYERLALRTTGMEFATEMVIKATLMQMKVKEIPTTLAPDGRTRAPHLRTWRDGWRTLRFFLLYSPRWLFLYPGFALCLLGLLVGAWLLPGPRRIGQVIIDVHTLLYAAIAVLLGFQAIAFAVFTKLFAITEGLHPPDTLLNRLFPYITLETGLMAGALLAATGLGFSFYAVDVWHARHFGDLDFSSTFRLVIPAALCLTLGVQVIFSSLFISVLGMRRK